MRHIINYLIFSILLTLFVFVAGLSTSYSEVILMQDGSIIKGQILKRGLFYIDVNVHSHQLSLRNSEIYLIAEDGTFNYQVVMPFEIWQEIYPKLSPKYREQSENNIPMDDTLNEYFSGSPNESAEETEKETEHADETESPRTLFSIKPTTKLYRFLPEIAIGMLSDNDLDSFYFSYGLFFTFKFNQYAGSQIYIMMNGTDQDYSYYSHNREYTYRSVTAGLNLFIRPPLPGKYWLPAVTLGIQILHRIDWPKEWEHKNDPDEKIKENQAYISIGFIPAHFEFRRFVLAFTNFQILLIPKELNMAFQFIRLGFQF
jgi:hypothetical protein